MKSEKSIQKQKQNNKKTNEKYASEKKVYD